MFTSFLKGSDCGMLQVILLSSFRFMWPCIINVGEERTNRWHRYRCLFTIN